MNKTLMLVYYYIVRNARTGRVNIKATLIEKPQTELRDVALLSVDYPNDCVRDQPHLWQPLSLGSFTMKPLPKNQFACIPGPPAGPGKPKMKHFLLLLGLVSAASCAHAQERGLMCEVTYNCD
jgi:hypothetical protein